jgi:hypothetical protein
METSSIERPKNYTLAVNGLMGTGTIESDRESATGGEHCIGLWESRISERKEINAVEAIASLS